MSDRSLLRHLEERGFSGVGKVALKRMLPYLKLPNEKTYWWCRVDNLVADQ